MARRARCLPAQLRRLLGRRAHRGRGGLHQAHLAFRQVQALGDVYAVLRRIEARLAALNDSVGGAAKNLPIMRKALVTLARGQEALLGALAEGGSLEAAGPRLMVVSTSFGGPIAVPLVLICSLACAPSENDTPGADSAGSDDDTDTDTDPDSRSATDSATDTGEAAASRLEGTIEFDGLDEILGGSNDIRIGEVMLSGFDLTADGAADLIAGAPNGDTVGYVYVYDPTNAEIFEVSHDRDSDYSENYFGYSIDAGDIDADGSVDLLVGSPRWGSGDPAGALFVVYGPITTGRDAGSDGSALAYGSSSYGSQLGTTVAAVGDVDGDGLADAVAAFEDYAGSSGAWVFSGLAEGGTYDHNDPAISFAPDNGGEEVRALRGALDADGDGVPELALGAIEHGGAGALLVYRGPVSGAITPADAEVVVTGAGAGDDFGWVAAWADADGDGSVDALVSAPGAGGGAVYALAAPLGSGDADTLALARFDGAVSGDGAGTGLSVGDFDGDGALDVAIAAPYNDEGYPGLDSGSPGAAYLQYGLLTGTFDLAEAHLTVLGGQRGVAFLRCGYRHRPAPFPPELGFTRVDRGHPASESGRPQGRGPPVREGRRGRS